MIKKIIDQNENEIDKYILTNLNNNLIKKEKFGEVFTHPDLINKLLDLFPKTVWSNPDLLWLEPNCGKGFFVIKIFQRLMKGLKSKIINNKKRAKHIIEKMIYMVELNKENVNYCKKLFGEKANIICSDYLNPDVFSDIKFDCIVGNPPFQDNFGLTKSGERILGGKNKLYERIFLKCSEQHLKQKGHMSFIVPTNMFSGNTLKSYQNLIQNFVTFVSFNKNIIDYFPKLYNIDMCYFHMIKKSNIDKLNTLIESQDGSHFSNLLIDRPVNPVSNWTLLTEQLTKKYISSDKNVVVYNRGKPINEYKGNKYKLVYTPSKFLKTNNEQIAIGLNIKKAILFLMSPTLEFIMDYAGTYGVGPNVFYIPFNTNFEGNKIEHFLKSSDYKQLAFATRTNRKFLKIPFIEHINFTKITSKKGITKKQTNKKTNNKKKTRKTK
jgi:hypothetical protein